MTFGELIPPVCPRCYHPWVNHRPWDSDYPSDVACRDCTEREQRLGDGLDDDLPAFCHQDKDQRDTALAKLPIFKWDGTTTQVIPPGYERRGCNVICACTGQCNDLVPIETIAHN